jgi:ABC transporter substrate binding protein
VNRREFISLIGGGAAAWPLAARAQQQPSKAARIGYLSAASAPDVNIESFRQGMRSFGYVEGPDFVIEPRYAERDYSRFPALIEELLRAKVELIVTGGPSSRAAPLAGRSVPVVFGFSGDPVEAGIITSFARPATNATGMSFLSLDLAAKRVEMLKEAAPTVTRLAVLSNHDHRGADLPHLLRHDAPAACHPHIVPSQHGEGQDEDDRVEEFLARAFEQGRNLPCEVGHQTCTYDTGRYAIADPEAALRDALGCGEDDANDESGLDDLAKNDQECREHPDPHSAITTPCAVSGWYSPMNG